MSGFFQSRACALVVMGLFILVWAIVDVVKLSRWAETDGQITQFHKFYHRHSMYYRATVVYTLEDSDGVAQKYSFVSRFHFEDKSQQYETVTVLYSATDPTKAELKRQIKGEAKAMGFLSIFAVVMALMLYQCDRSARRYLLDNHNHNSLPGSAGFGASPSSTVQLTSASGPNEMLSDGDYGAMMDEKEGKS